MSRMRPTLETLPFDVKNHIASYLSLQDIANVLFVSKTWMQEWIAFTHITESDAGILGTVAHLQSDVNRARTLDLSSRCMPFFAATGEYVGNRPKMQTFSFKVKNGPQAYSLQRHLVTNCEKTGTCTDMIISGLTSYGLSMLLRHESRVLLFVTNLAEASSNVVASTQVNEGHSSFLCRKTDAAARGSVAIKKLHYLNPCSLRIRGVHGPLLYFCSGDTIAGVVHQWLKFQPDPKRWTQLPPRILCIHKITSIFRGTSVSRSLLEWLCSQIGPATHRHCLFVRTAVFLQVFMDLECLLANLDPAPPLKVKGLVLIWVKRVMMLLKYMPTRIEWLLWVAATPWWLDQPFLAVKLVLKLACKYKYHADDPEFKAWWTPYTCLMDRYDTCIADESVYTKLCAFIDKHFGWTDADRRTNSKQIRRTFKDWEQLVCSQFTKSHADVEEDDWNDVQTSKRFRSM